MAGPVVTFDGYTFTNLGKFNPHFTKQRTASHRFGGVVGGGFDVFGAGASTTEEHTLSLDFALIVTDRDNLQASIDAVTALADSGKTALFYTPAGAATARFCYARVADIDVSQDFSTSQVWLKGRIQFAVTEPRWYNNATIADAKACSGVLTEWTVTYSNGNTDAIPISVTIKPPTGKTITDPILRRRIDGVLKDEISYVGTVPALTTLGIFCESMRVSVGGVDAYSAFDALHADWFRLEPGANTLQLIADNAGDEATVTVNYRETYR